MEESYNRVPLIHYQEMVCLDRKKVYTLVFIPIYVTLRISNWSNKITHKQMRCYRFHGINSGSLLSNLQQGNSLFITQLSL